MKLSKVKFDGDLQSSIKKALEPLGGLSKFISSNDKILLKPNFNTADPYPASSDFEFIKTVVQLVFSLNPREVYLGDSSTMMLKTEDVMKRWGIERLKTDFPNLNVVDFDRGEWVSKNIPNARYLKTVSTPKILDQVDKLILLPCLKTHKHAQFTGSLKLSVAFMRPRERVALHTRNLQEKIAELNKVIDSDLVIMDGRKCFITEGPSRGEVREPNVILASESRIDIDTEGIKIIQECEGNDLEGIEPKNLPQIKHAIESKVE